MWVIYPLAKILWESEEKLMTKLPKPPRNLRNRQNQKRKLSEFHACGTDIDPTLSKYLVFALTAICLK